MIIELIKKIEAFHHIFIFIFIEFFNIFHIFDLLKSVSISATPQSIKLCFARCFWKNEGARTVMNSKQLNIM